MESNKENKHVDTGTYRGNGSFGKSQHCSNKRRLYLLTCVDYIGHVFVRFRSLKIKIRTAINIHFFSNYREESESAVTLLLLNNLRVALNLIMKTRLSAKFLL